MSKTNYSKTFGQYVTANYNFYTFVKEKIVFLVMVESNVSISIFSTKPELLWAFLKKFSKFFSSATIQTEETQLLPIHWKISNLFYNSGWGSIAARNLWISYHFWKKSWASYKSKLSEIWIKWSREVKRLKSL